MKDYYNVDINSDNARELWDKANIPVTSLTWDDMGDLAAFIQLELIPYRKTVKDPIIISVYPSKMTKTQKKKAEFKGVEIDGTYFHGREGITFYDNGFVGFCGEMSRYNRIPIFAGFYKWLETKVKAVE